MSICIPTVEGARESIDELVSVLKAVSLQRGRLRLLPPRLAQVKPSCILRQELKLDLLYQLYDDRKRTVKEICDVLDISRSTCYAYLQRREGKDEGEKKA